MYSVVNTHGGRQLALGKYNIPQPGCHWMQSQSLRWELFEKWYMSNHVLLEQASCHPSRVFRSLLRQLLPAGVDRSYPQALELLSIKHLCYGVSDHLVICTGICFRQVPWVETSDSIHAGQVRILFVLFALFVCLSVCLFG